MWITQKTYISFNLPSEYTALCDFEKKNDLRDAKKYEDTISVTYEFVNHWYSKGADDEQDV